MDRSKSPAAILCFEHLETKLYRILNNSVQARFGAFALRVALVDSSQDGFLKPPELVTSLGPDLAPNLPPGGLDGQLPAGATLLVAAVVLAVAAGQESRVSRYVDIFLRKPLGRVVNVFIEA